MGTRSAGSIFATQKVFSRTKFAPTQKINAFPTNDRSAISPSLITAPNKAAINVMIP